MVQQNTESSKAPLLDSKPRIIEWYQKLNKPPLQPPVWVFPVGWSILYVLIAYSGFRYLRSTDFEITNGALVYAIQVVLNLLWFPLFFLLMKPTWALIDIIFLLAMIVWNINEFAKTDKLSAQLLYPYFVWVSFATYLNVYIVLNNK